MRAARVRVHSSLRVATYNILLGGRQREDLISDVLTRVDADVIALQEVCNLDFLTALARRLRMEALIGEPSESNPSCAIAILTRRPVRRWQNRRHTARMLRSHLHCEIETGWKDMPAIGVHCVHLAARFGERNKGEARRMRELTAILEDIADEPALPHMIAGDFNSVSPGDEVLATSFFRTYNEMRRLGLLASKSDGTLVPVQPTAENKAHLDGAWRRAGIDPRLEGGIPTLPRIVGPLTVNIPVNRAIDRFMSRFIERWTIERMLRNGYVDAFRRVHPRAHGLTVATWTPAARVDYIFATPELARRLAGCDVVGDRRWPDPDAAHASDHFPVCADFA